LAPAEVHRHSELSGSAAGHSIYAGANSIARFGFTNPVLVSDEGETIAGHGRVMAAKLLGMAEVPTLALSHLSATERRADVLADNKLALNAGWDNEIMAIELQGLIDLEFDVDLTGFSLAEIDFVLDEAREGSAEASNGSEDKIPLAPDRPVTRAGNLWHLGRHRLLCGDARVPAVYGRLLGNKPVDLIFNDPPAPREVD
jgi:ParB-like chromosome segregation protein Spo0J